MRVKLLALAGLVAAQAAIASDHVDGPVTTKHKVGDITDFYAFPSPQNPGHLTLVVTTYPVLPTEGHFSEKVKISVLLRPAIIDRKKKEIRAGEEELKITCHFNDAHDKDSRVRCISNTGLKSSARIDSPRWEGDFALFAGRRADPFFFDQDWYLSKVLKAPILPSPGGSNSLAKMSVLTVVMEIPKSKIFGGRFDLLALAAQTTTSDKGGAEERRLDYFGRPEFSNFLLIPKPGAKELRDMRNQEIPFAMSESGRTQYARRIQDTVGFLDKLDGKIDWEPEEVVELSGLLVNDHLVIDLSKKPRGGEYLSIEKAVLAGKGYESCGGRQITDDIVDLLLNLCVNRNRGPDIGDGVDAPAHPPTRTFPYLTRIQDRSKKGGASKSLRWFWSGVKCQEWVEGGRGLECRLRRRIHVEESNENFEVA